MRLPVWFKRYVKEWLKRKLGKDDVSLYFDLGDYFEERLGFIPIGIDYFVPSRKILSELLKNRIQEDKDVKSLLADTNIRHHIGEEGEDSKINPFSTRLSLYVFSKRIVILKKWLAEDLEGTSILEVGDADGIILENLGKRGISTNISSGAIKNIVRHGIKAVQCDIGQSPFKPKSFDIVMMFQTLEHLSDPINALNILAQLARKKVIISVPKVPKTNILPAGYDLSSPQYRLHIFEFNDADFEKIVTHTPLKISRRETISVFGRPKNFVQFRMYLYHNHEYNWHGFYREFSYYELSFK